MAGAKKVRLSERTHPLYEKYIKDWEFYENATIGGSNMITEDYLFSHRLEDSTDYDDRLKRAYYLNFCDTIPSIYNSYIFKDPIERSPDDNLIVFRENTDGRLTSIGDFVKKAGYFASIYGSIHALIDITTTEKKQISKRDVRTGVISPYATLILPTQLVDWSVDSSGELRWILIKSIYYRDDDPTIEREEEEHYKLITREEWSIEDKDGNPVKFPDEGQENKGQNTLGIVPITTMYHKDIDNNRIGESLIKDIAYINRAILNWCSCIDEQIDRQTFSQLVMPDDGTLAELRETGEDPMQKVGTSSIFTFPYESSQPPQFISPSSDNITSIWDLVGDHIKEIFRLSGLIGGTGDLYASKSGKASQVGFQAVNSALSEKSGNYEKFENAISKFAYLQMGQNPEEYELTKYPRTFDIASLSEEIESYFKIMGSYFSPTLNKEIQRGIARKAVPLASQTVRAEIEKEIESGDGHIEIVSTNSENGKMDEGNPNVNVLSNTHRSKADLKKDEVDKQKKEE